MISLSILFFLSIFILFFLVFEPIVTYIGFMIGGTVMANQLSMIAGVLSILFIFQISNKKNRKILAFLAIYLILSLVLHEQVEGSRMYVSALLCSYAAFLYFLDFDEWNISVEKADFLFLSFIILLSIAQITCIEDPLSFIRTNQESLE